MSNKAKHTNRLAEETSPYLLQHAHNPVDWYPWGEEALARARKEDKPILLSIGYSACHWCHVMERESFENEGIAAQMNAGFVCIKVDREERPDLDDIYMAATVTTTGQGGWPMTVFLTPDQKPFFAGTYFPPEDNQGRPGFSTLLQHFTQMWKDQRPALLEGAEKITARLKRMSQGAKTVGQLEPNLVELAADDLAERFDKRFGGFGPAPKFPPAASLQLLLRTRDPRALEMAQKTLDGMAGGGLYDQIGGGFARYSTDERWLVPHFEKMLYDNALLVPAYLEAFQATGDALYERIARETLDYVLREMTSPEGGFYSSTDADSEGEEGKFFVWTPQQIEAVLGQERGEKFCAFYDITAAGNWEGKSIPNTADPRAFTDEVKKAREEVYAARQKRVAPGRDEKILTAWNGMMIAAFAAGHRVLGEPRYLEAAVKAAEFLWKSHRKPDGRLLRTSRDGKAHLDAYLEDYAWLGEGLLEAYEAGGPDELLTRAKELGERIRAEFADPEGGAFYDTGTSHEELLVRHRSGTDGATPAGNAVAAGLLARLSYHFDQKEWREQALGALSAFSHDMRRMPSAFCRSLSVVDLCAGGPVELVFTAGSGLDELAREAGRHYVPNRVVAWSRGPSELPLLKGKTPGAKAQLFVCRGSVCMAPVDTASAVAEALEPATQAPAAIGGTPGRATPEATKGLAKDRPNAYVELGRTGLTVSRLGFGGYRIDDESAEHLEALELALEKGVNLIDTSTNYTDGASERIVGEALKGKDRASMVVVSKLGYVQGQNLELALRRARRGEPFPEMVEFSENCWHCLHPSYLEDQLQRSLTRLGVETLDVCLLHNPEYFLTDCKQRANNDLTWRRREFYRRVEEAFRWLEEQVKAGRVGCYGVSSNTLADPAEKSETTSLEELVITAQKAGGEDHHFKVIQLPLNLIEGEAVLGASRVLEIARQNGLGVLVNRPLNAFKAEKMARLADFESDEEADDFTTELEELGQLEDEYRATFGPYVQGPGSDQLFRWKENLATLPENLQNLDHWTQLEAMRIRPGMLEMVGALDQAMNGPLIEAWVGWRERYLKQWRDLMNATEELAIARSQAVSERIAAQLKPHLPENDLTLSQKALWVLMSTPGVSTVLVGMRQPEYVEDACEVLDRPLLGSVEPAFKALADW